MTELKQYPNIRKVDAFELDNTIYICYVDRCNPNNIVWMKVDRADPEKDLETYNLLEKLRIEVKMTNPEIIVERKKYGSSAAMDYTMRVYQKLDEETIMIDGVKYKRVEEPKPQTLKELLVEWYETANFVQSKDVIANEIVNVVAKWLPGELEYEEDEMGYNQGWNDCFNKIKKNLR
jgi:hypothetical protein